VSTAPESPAPASEPPSERAEVRIRRVPKYGVFLGLGAILGVIAALIATSLGDLDPDVGFAATFGYLALWGIAIGLAVGGVVAVIVDAVLRRRARTLVAERRETTAD